MIYAKDITNINHVQDILDNIRNHVRVYESTCGKIPEKALENITFQLCEIEEFIIGPQKLTKLNIANADLRMMGYWKYIDGKRNFWNMMREIKKYEGSI